MKNKLFAILTLAFLSTLNSPLATAHAQGSAFTYQGRLNSGVNPANGSYDVAFTLYGVNAGGSGVAGPVTNVAVTVTNGLFTTTVDLGNAFNGADRWLELAVRTNGSGAFTTLAPRQQVTPTPYAILATTAGVLSGTLPASQVSGVVTLAQLPAAVMTNFASNVSGSGFFAGDFGGSFFGNGSGLTGLNPANLSAGTAPINVSGNAATATTAATATNLTGNVSDAQLPANLARLNGTNTFTGTNTFAAVTIATNANNVISGLFNGNGGGLTNLNTAQFANSVVTNGQTGLTLGGTFTGNGSGLTGLNASSLVGTLATAQLPASVITNGASGVNISGTFSGNGAGVTNLIVPLNSVNSFGTISAAGNFLLASSPVVGANPQSVTVADVNGDGKLDLITANYAANTLTVLTNNGSGGFALASSPGVGNSPDCVTAADVNGDGKPDLISANAGSLGNGNTLTVLTNNGSGGFVLASSPVVGGGPISVVAADVNGDGKPDLISANYGSLGNGNTLTVLTNNGNGGFVLASSPGVGSNPFSVCAADVNGDGKVDLICAKKLSSTLIVFTNIGSGVFGSGYQVPVGAAPSSVCAADVNGDGKVDLISANTGNGAGNTLTVLTNNGSGGFVLASSPVVGSAPVSVISADVNGDGKPDLISANVNSQTLTVLFNAITFTGIFQGDGSGLSSLNPGNLSGTIPDAKLSANVPLLSGGRLNDGYLSANVALRAGGNTFTGDQIINGTVTANGFSGSGAGLTSLNPANLTGTILDAQLSSNVALRSGGNTFTGNQVMTDTLSFGSTTRQMLTLYGANYAVGVQASSLYFRCDNSASTDGFSWYKGGVHNDAYANAGGGVELMHLVQGALYVNGTFVSASDRNLKENFKPVSAREMLDKVAALPISRWNYKQDTSSEHVGPMAQDFYAAFSVGPDDKHITVVDESGVALAAIQGLNQKLEAQRAANEELKRQVAELKQLILSLVPKQ